MPNTDRFSLLERWANGAETFAQAIEDKYGPAPTPPQLPPYTIYDAMLEAIADNTVATKRLLNKKSPTYHSDSVAYVKTVPSGDVHYASLEKIGGKTVVWNQLVDSGTTTVATISGHKYYTLIDGTASIVTSSGSAITIVDDTADMVTDLTLCYGSGNEPSTVAEFQQTFPAQYYPYNAGQLLSAGVTEVKSVGINIWDEQWEVGGLNTTTGATTTQTDRIRSKNYISVQPNISYYFNYLSDNMVVLCYDFEKNYTGTYYYRSISQPVQTLPQETCYIRFYMVSAYGTTYKNDICIHVSSASTNGNYYPYNAHTYPIPASIQALDGYGWSAGTVFNYIDYEAKKFVKNVKSKTISNDTWVYNSTYGVFVDNGEQFADSPQWICQLYPYGGVYSSAPDQSLCWIFTNRIAIKDSTLNGDVTALMNKINGVTAYCQAKTPIETDISAYLTDDNLIEVEPNGTLTFPNSNGDDYRIPVPSSETFIVGEP